MGIVPLWPNRSSTTFLKVEKSVVGFLLLFTKLKYMHFHFTNYVAGNRPVYQRKKDRLYSPFHFDVIHNYMDKLNTVQSTYGTLLCEKSIHQCHECKSFIIPRESVLIRKIGLPLTRILTVSGKRCLTRELVPVTLTECSSCYGIYRYNYMKNYETYIRCDGISFQE